MAKINIEIDIHVCKENKSRFAITRVAGRKWYMVKTNGKDICEIKYCPFCSMELIKLKKIKNITIT